MANDESVFASIGLYADCGRVLKHSGGKHTVENTMR